MIDQAAARRRLKNCEIKGHIGWKNPKTPRNTPKNWINLGRNSNREAMANSLPSS